MTRTIWIVVTPWGTQAILSLLGTLSSSSCTRKPSAKPCTQPRQLASRWIRGASLFPSLSTLEQTSRKSRPDLLISGSSGVVFWPVPAVVPTNKSPSSAATRSRRTATSNPSSDSTSNLCACPPTPLLASLPASSTIAALATGGEMSFSRRFEEIRTGFERPFWVANITELFERLSYYAVFASLARYLHEVLNFPTERATNLTGLFGCLVLFLASFGGSIADRLGFRRALSLAYMILAGSYFLLGSIGARWLPTVRNLFPLVVLSTILLVLPPLGVALVKPCVVGTTARASKENVRSIGYSIYYTLVNIGRAIGPWLAGVTKQHLPTAIVFRMAALSVFLMVFVVLGFFKEPQRSGETNTASTPETLRNFLQSLWHPKFLR